MPGIVTFLDINIRDAYVILTSVLTKRLSGNYLLKF